MNELDVLIDIPPAFRTIAERSVLAAPTFTYHPSSYCIG